MRTKWAVIARPISAFAIVLSPDARLAAVRAGLPRPLGHVRQVHARYAEVGLRPGTLPLVESQQDVSAAGALPARHETPLAPAESLASDALAPPVLEGAEHGVDRTACRDDVHRVGAIGDVDATCVLRKGQVGIEPPAPEVSKGIYAKEGSDLDAVRVTAPVLIGTGSHVGEGASLHGPVVVGDGCDLGAGAMLRECVVLPGAQVPSGGLVVGGLYGIDPDRPLG